MLTLLHRRKNRLLHRFALAATLLAGVSALAQGMFGAAGANPPGTNATGARPPVLREVGFDQLLNAQVPLDTQFYDESGKQVRLKDFLAAGKPVIVAPVYFTCPMLCSEVLNGLTSSLKTLRFNAGQDFQVLAISFDPNDTPESATAKKANYVRRYDRPGTESGFHFLTADAPAIRMFTDSIGFHYAWDAKYKQYAHVAGIVLLTPEGKISRYFYGVEFAPRDLRLGLVEASEHRIGSISEQVLLFCYHYDPTTGKYTPLVLKMVRTGGVLTLIIMGTFIGVMVRRERKAKGRTA